MTINFETVSCLMRGGLIRLDKHDGTKLYSKPIEIRGPIPDELRNQKLFRGITGEVQLIQEHPGMRMEGE
jgi:hypothetical protein